MSDLLEKPETILDKKIAGLTITRWLDSDTISAWYEAKEDAGAKRIIYVYLNQEDREKNILRIHGFHTRADETIDIDENSVKVFCIVGDYRISMPRPIKQYLISSQTQPPNIAGYEVIDYLGSGFKGVTYMVQKKTSPKTKYVLKLTIAEEYQNGSYLPEVNRMVDLASKDRDHFPQVHDCGEWETKIDGTQRKFIYFVEDYIAGLTLDKYLTENGNKLTALFLEKFIDEMLAALTVMEALDLMHDDLHAGNIIICSSLAGDRPCLIDFGSTKSKSNTRKIRDDIRNLATHIAAITNTISSRSEAKSPYEYRILSACEALLAVMSDDDPMRRPDSAKDLLRRFQDQYPQESFEQTLTHPFDFGNAEEVMDNQLLYQLSAKSFPWKDKIESSANLLIIGPRGCGKTTVFRSMSFRCLADANHIDDALSRPYIGLYISCNKDFRQRFSALEPSLLRNRHDDIRHYFNLLVLREFCGVMICCAKKDLLAVGDVRSFLKFIQTNTGISCGAFENQLASLSFVEGGITRLISVVRMCLWNDKESSNRTHQDFVAELAELAQGSISPFKAKVLYLLVDDYTERKVPSEVQSALNHVLFVPGSVYKSKISSEVFGIPLDRTFGSFLDQDRDYKEWNLGTLYYLNLPTEEQKSFLKDIVDTRLELCKFAGKVTDIIGDSNYPDGTLARAIKKEAEKRQESRQKQQTEGTTLLPPDEQKIDIELEHRKAKAYYHGWDTICDLCTGDVSNILELLSRMYEYAGVKHDTVLCIQPERQHTVIQNYSQQYISKIKGIPTYGEKLFELVDAFGTMSGRLLKEYPFIERSSDRRDPYQVIRIEMDEGFVRSSDNLMHLELNPESSATTGSQKAAFLWILLQRYCIFIDADESRSRRNTLASKVIFRRIFCPAFSASLTNSECFTVDKGQWEEFCTDPKGYADRYVRDTVDKAKARRGDYTGQLFSKEQLNGK